MLVVYVVLKRGATRPPVDPHMTRSKCSEADKAPSTKSYIRPIPVAVAEKPLYFSTTSTKKKEAASHNTVVLSSRTHNMEQIFYFTSQKTRRRESSELSPESKYYHQQLWN